MLETHAPTLETLFAQLGLDNTPEAIEQFIAQHPLPADTHITEAPFWNCAQKALLTEALANDDDWAEPVDELNALLHEAYQA
ncbi:DUF2789 domain-containing protein [Galenea microaerophila]